MNQIFTCAFFPSRVAGGRNHQSTSPPLDRDPVRVLLPGRGRPGQDRRGRHRQRHDPLLHVDRGHRGQLGRLHLGEREEESWWGRDFRVKTARRISRQEPKRNNFVIEKYKNSIFWESSGIIDWFATKYRNPDKLKSSWQAIYVGIN